VSSRERERPDAAPLLLARFGHILNGELRPFTQEATMRRFVLPVIAVGTVLIFGPALRADDDAKEIIKKAIAATGGEEKLSKFKAYKESSKGTVSIMGNDLEFSMETVAAPPSKIKNVMKMEFGGNNVTFEQSVNGDKMKASLNGMDLPVPDEQKDDVKQQLFMRQAIQLVPLVTDSKFQLAKGDEIKVDDKPAVGVKISSKDLKEIKFYFDKSTNLLVRVEREGSDPNGGGKVKQEITFSDYKEMDGIQSPAKVVMVFDGKQFLEAKVTEHKSLEKVDDKDFGD
jgi:hypothetical protein